MSSQQSGARRPYWHVDAKWVTGLVLVVLLSVTLLLSVFVQLTAERPAVDAMSTLLAVSFSRKGLDDESEIVEVRDAIRASPDGFQPVPGLPMVIREKDIVGMSPRQMRLFVWRQLAEPLYRGGVAGLAAQIRDPEMRKAVSEGIGVLGWMNAGTHRGLQRLLTMLQVACAILLVPLVVFSYRFGRLGSPGLALLVSSLPGALVSGLAQSALSSHPVVAAPSEQSGITGMLGYLAGSLLPAVVPVAWRTYSGALLAGLGLVALAVLGNLLWWLLRGIRPRPKDQA